MKAPFIDRSRPWTVDEFLLMGEMKTPCELINGEVFMSPGPAPFHQIVSANLFKILNPEAEKNGGVVFYAPMDLYIDSRNVFQPDLLYVSSTNLQAITKRGIEGVPDMTVEIISPANAFKDRNVKKNRYLSIGVQEFWLIDPAKKSLEIYTPATGEDSPSLSVTGEGRVISRVLPGVNFILSEIFVSRIPT